MHVWVLAGERGRGGRFRGIFGVGGLPWWC